MAENNREINIAPIELNLDELLALEPDEVEVNPVEEFTLIPEGKSSDATDSSSVATDSNSDARAAKERLEENINWWQSGGAINLNDMTLMASKGKGFKQTDKDILDFVVRNFPGGFDLKGARKAGFSDTQILSKLTGLVVRVEQKLLLKVQQEELLKQDPLLQEPLPVGMLACFLDRERG
jgi:hypothetical protein